jgi:hypothetical protein
MTTKTRMPSIVVAALSLGVSYEAVEDFLKQHEAKKSASVVVVNTQTPNNADAASGQVPQV